MERRNSPSTCTEDALLEIENDSSICFSDSEKSWKGYETDSEAHKDYWYGKKYFECAIARKTLEESVADESLTLIDRFDFEEGVTTLRTFGIKSRTLTGQERTVHMEFLSLMGSVVRQGSESERRAVNATLRTSGATTSSVQHGRPKTSVQLQQPQGDQDLQASSSTNASDMPDIALYTMALKERGDQQRVTPLYTEQTVKLAPPTFRVAVEFQGNTFEAWGSSKKEAKHEASKKACNHLGLKIR